jgi:hypothetical protein
MQVKVIRPIAITGRLSAPDVIDVRWLQEDGRISGAARVPFLLANRQHPILKVFSAKIKVSCPTKFPHALDLIISEREGKKEGNNSRN